MGHGSAEALGKSEARCLLLPSTCGSEEGSAEARGRAGTGSRGSPAVVSTVKKPGYYSFRIRFEGHESFRGIQVGPRKRRRGWHAARESNPQPPDP